MTPEEKQAYEWAINQNFPSVAARYARILAGRITALEAENERLRAVLKKIATTHTPQSVDNSITRWQLADTARRALEGKSE